MSDYRDIVGAGIAGSSLAVALGGQGLSIALSRVRQMMDFSTREWDYGHRAIVGTVEVANSHENTAWQRFTPSATRECAV